MHEFIRAYQGISRLNLGELWAFPVMLRLAGIENLRNAALQVLRRQQDGEQGRESDHNQAADEIAVRNGILSLHALGGLDWKSFVEEESAVEQTLRRDPAGVYGQMDFESRDRCRQVVERLAQRSSLTEQEVADARLELAQNGDGVRKPQDRPPTRREQAVWAHVGCFLVDEGRAALENAVAYRPAWRESVARQPPERRSCAIWAR